MSVTLYYLGGLADPEKVPFINVSGGDRVFRLPNKVGATVQVDIEAQARHIMNSHQLVRKDGAYAVFTDNKGLFDRLRAAQSRPALPPKKLTKEELLAELKALEDAEKAGAKE